jgi:hypothetical protein
MHTEFWRRNFMGMSTLKSKNETEGVSIIMVLK